MLQLFLGLKCHFLKNNNRNINENSSFMTDLCNGELTAIFYLSILEYY